MNALVDTALTVQLEALAAQRTCRCASACRSCIEEEAFHAAHGAAWFRRMAAGSGQEGHDAMQRAALQVLPAVVRWFGPDSARARLLQDASIADVNGSGMRNRYIERVAPLLRLIADDAALLEHRAGLPPPSMSGSRRTLGTDAR
jgi:1,2-phenylacetyl-CoA epoxidase catalytic subunit